MSRVVCTGLGQDSHRFLLEEETKPCVIAGISFDAVPGLDADSDGDVVFHALCNAISSLTHVAILGKVAIDLCKQGITDSRHYLDHALATLPPYTIEHLAFSIEGARPKFQPHALAMRQSIATATKIELHQVGITFTSGDHLTAFGRGEGLMCLCLLSASREMRCS